MNMLRDMITGNDQELVRAKLTDIDETINDTAVDVFIYDTSKDSDGGAWRHRTQHTSWYAEASSASRDPNTRSTRAEFPAVAVIVAEYNKVTIYDGDDPSLPMWMVFNANGASGDRSFWASGFDISSLAAKNGVISFGIYVTSVGSGVALVNFGADALERVGTTSGRGGVYSGVSDRNSDPTLSGTVVPIVNSVVNDVAMTVLPDAPIDPATGIAVPTIAIGTAGGVSVIKDDGTVVSGGELNSGWRVTGLFFDGEATLWATEGTSYSGLQRMAVPPYSSVEDIGSPINGGYGYPFYNPSDTVNTYGVPQNAPKLNNPGSTTDGRAMSGRGDVLSIGAASGLSTVYHNSADQLSSLVAYTTSSYNTGWMPGDIKLAALADTTAETLGDAASGATVSDPNNDGVYDGDHIVNGKFATNDLTGWTDQSIGTGSSNASTGSVRMQGTDTSNRGWIEQAITTVAGATYVVSLDVTVDGGGLVSVSASPSSMGNGLLDKGTTVAGVLAQTFVATDTTTYIGLRTTGVTDMTVDDISVRLADPDRSVNGKGLGVHGSITKAPVATGADVVAYSGFDSSNYLEQPYNSALNFGTGDFCVMGWVNSNNVGTQRIVNRQSADKYININLNGAILRTQFSSGSALETTIIPTNVWTFFCVTRKDGVVSDYVNGAFGTSKTNTIDLTDADAVLKVGLDFSGLQPFNGSLALFRISATAPTADQIKKIYEDEKVLFQEGAKATLYGTSDAVTALAHDPVTDLLHVGTSGGRSVFQGLRRVEEHTGTDSQSLAAISAVDGLVVEGK